MPIVSAKPLIRSQPQPVFSIRRQRGHVDAWQPIHQRIRLPISLSQLLTPTLGHQARPTTVYTPTKTCEGSGQSVSGAVAPLPAVTSDGCVQSDERFVALLLQTSWHAGGHSEMLVSSNCFLNAGHLYDALTLNH